MVIGERRRFLNDSFLCSTGIRCTANGQGAFTQRIEHSQLLGDGPLRELSAKGAFTFPNTFEIRLHLYLRNCRSNCCQWPLKP